MSTTTRNPLGEKISVMRRSKGISQEVLAENSGVSLRTIQRIEGGASIPRPYTLKIIADALGVPMEVLNPPDSVDQVGLSKELDKLKLVNLSGLAVMILPLGNVILPLLLWRKNRNFPLVDETGRRIVSFHLLWTLATILIVGCAQVALMGMDYNMIGRFPPTILMVYTAMLLVNIAFVLKAAVSLHLGDYSIYGSIPKLF